MRRLTAVLLALALVCALVLVGCSAPASPGGSSGGSGSGSSGGSGSSASSAVTVTMRNFAFDPADSTVAVGGTITFVNNDSVTHDVSVDGADSGPIAVGGQWQHTFATAGTLPLKCTIHPQMTGTVTVK